MSKKKKSFNNPFEWRMDSESTVMLPVSCQIYSVFPRRSKGIIIFS